MIDIGGEHVVNDNGGGDGSTANENGDVTPSSNHENLAASFQGMGLMGGTAPTQTAPTPMEHSRHANHTHGTTTVHTNIIVAPPPAAAPPLPPPDSPQKQMPPAEADGHDQQAYVSVDALLDAGPATQGQVRQQQRQSRQNKSLLDSLTGSLLMGDAGASGGSDGLFGEDGDDLFGGDHEDDERMFRSSVQNQQEENGKHPTNGTLISEAPSPAPAALEPRSFPNPPPGAGPAAMPPAPPPDASFYRNHDRALPQPAHNRSTSNQSIGTASTLTVNTMALGGAQLPIKGHNHSVNYMNGNPHNSNNNTAKTQAKKKKPREPFLIPDYIIKFKPLFKSVTVGDPRQLSGGGVSLLLASVTSGSSKYWVYMVSCTTARDNKTTHVQRRFRHFDALQDRLRQACPGAILPSRPAKHTSRAIEEGAAAQSPAFAAQRAKELHYYLNALIVHPIAGNSEPLNFFLTFLDTDLGTAWPEVSNSALTRLTVGMTKTAAGAAGGNAPSSPQHGGPSLSLSFDHMGGGGGQTVAAAAAARAMDDNSDLVELATNESHRINLIQQSIPKLEAFLIQLGDWQEAQASLAKECMKLSKEMGNEDRPLSLASDVLSTSLRRSAHRSRRMVAESHAALDSYLQEPRLCRMEKAAFQDRREAFIHWWNLRQQAEHKSSKVIMMRQNGIAVQLHKFEAEAAHFIQLMDDASDKVTDISIVLQSEVIRLSKQRSQEWRAGLKIWVCSQKEAHTELMSIWQDAKVHYTSTFPSEEENGTNGTSNT